MTSHDVTIVINLVRFKACGFSEVQDALAQTLQQEVAILVCVHSCFTREGQDVLVSAKPQLHGDVSRSGVATLRFNQHHRSEEHTSELQSRGHLVCRLLLEKKNRNSMTIESTVDR